MTAVTVLVVPEKVSHPGQPARYVYHLPDGPWDRDAVWQPIPVAHTPPRVRRVPRLQGRTNPMSEHHLIGEPAPTPDLATTRERADREASA